METANTPQRSGLRLVPLLEGFTRRGVKKSKGYELIDLGQLPPPVVINGRKYFPEHELDACIASLIAERDAQTTRRSSPPANLATAKRAAS